MRILACSYILPEETRGNGDFTFFLTHTEYQLEKKSLRGKFMLKNNVTLTI